MLKHGDISIDDLCVAGLHVVDFVLRQTLDDLDDDPEIMLFELRIGHWRKKALRIDVDAEDSFRRELHKYKNRKFRDIEVYGEERLRNPKLDLSGKSGIVALVDAIDGTDLLERGLFNWCTAAVFFNPTGERGKRILAAFVGFPSPRKIYYAHCESKTAYVKQGGQPAIPVKGPSTVTSLKDASICFYGQKLENFLSLTKKHQFLNYLIQLNEQQRKISEERIGFRIYNLAGNPMMVKLVDHAVKEAHGIDIIFDIEGQKPHDVVPGAYIAKKGNAILKDLDGKNIDWTDLEDALLMPASEKNELKYILTSTENLFKEIHPLL